MNHNTLLTTAITAVLFLTAMPVFADSAKLFNSANGHYYQRFDAPNITWSTANANCKKLTAHLVTFSGTDNGVTNKESDFVYNQLVIQGNGMYLMGAVYDSTNYKWTWVTGEPFGNNYLYTDNGIYYAMYPSDGLWYQNDGTGTSINYGWVRNGGYVCEWDGNNFVANASVNDLNANNVPENASLYLDYKTNKHTVIIRDPKSKVTINTLTFATSITTPIGLAVIKDMNSNGIPEIAVLAGLNVQIKDAKNNATVLKSINFLSSSYIPRAITVMPDSNSNGYDELTVLGVQGSKTISETRDSNTGAVLFSDSY